MATVSGFTRRPAVAPVPPIRHQFFREISSLGEFFPRLLIGNDSSQPL
jgi:hypothetical protein